MTRDDFTAALQEQLRLRGITFRHGDLEDFVEVSWPVARQDPDPVTWAERFRDSGRGTATT